jgi:hypothetical protein
VIDIPQNKVEFGQKLIEPIDGDASEVVSDSLGKFADLRMQLASLRLHQYRPFLKAVRPPATLPSSPLMMEASAPRYPMTIRGQSRNRLNEPGEFAI